MPYFNAESRILCNLLFKNPLKFDMKQEVYFENIQHQIIKNLKSCNYELKIAVAWFTDKEIIKEVNKLIILGVKVEIIIYDDNINQKELFKELYYSKAKIWLSKKMMHNKFCIIDSKIVINGSYNWTNNASLNEENIQISIGNFTLVNQFKIQFEKLTKLCSTIDNFFEYSLSNLSKIDYEFKTFASKWPNYNFPYFIDTSELKPSMINDKIDFAGYFYIIKDQVEENNFLYLKFLISSRYSLAKIFNILKKKIEYPQKFDFVHKSIFDKNKVSEFKFKSYIVEYKGFLYSINNSGDIISEKFYFQHKVNSNLYIQETTSLYTNTKPYFITSNLEITLINQYVYKFIANKFLIVRNNNSDYLKKIGVLNCNNESVIPFLFDLWNDVYTDDFFELIEYPIYIQNQSINYIEEPNLDSNNYKNYDYFIHKFCTKTGVFLEKNLFKGKYSNIDSTFLFLSDKNFKYKDLYFKLKSFNLGGKNFGNKHYMTLINPHYYTINEFEQLKKVYDNKNNIDKLLLKFKGIRDVSEQDKANFLKTKNEGCYIATMVYKSYDNPNVIILREFRDEKLSRYYFGRMFIKFYYIYSPKYVKFVKNKKILNSISEIIIKRLVKTIKNKA